MAAEGVQFGGGEVLASYSGGRVVHRKSFTLAGALRCRREQASSVPAYPNLGTSAAPPYYGAGASTAPLYNMGVEEGITTSYDDDSHSFVPHESVPFDLDGYLVDDPTTPVDMGRPQREVRPRDPLTYS